MGRSMVVRRLAARACLGWLVGMLLAGCSATATATATAPDAAPALDAAARAHPVAFLDRIGWGADAAQLRQLRQWGATRWLDAQLRPGAPAALPAEVARTLEQLPVNAPLDELIPPLVAQRRALRMAGGDAKAADALRHHVRALVEQALAQQILLDVYARNQLQQRLIWFWMNHFNVFRGAVTGPMLADYQRRVIAPHALGHFRALLRATMFSPQMLLYLNNAQNARGHINENYAREVMELHTLGVRAGYTQADVTKLAHVLTGLGVNLSGRAPARVRVWGRGLVVFRPARHDPRPELVLGHVFQGNGVDEIGQVVDLLAAQPATARHVSGELARYFVADRPDPALVDAMVETWRRSDGDIAAVLRTMFTSPQFAASLARAQFKDPMRYVISAARAGLDGRVVRNPRPLLGMLAELGEPLCGRSTPDGYPAQGGEWSTPGQLTTRFAIAQRFAAGAPGLFGSPPAYLQAASQDAGAAPGARVPPPDLSSSAVFVAMRPTLARASRQALAQADGRARWNALWLASPEFMNQ